MKRIAKLISILGISICSASCLAVEMVIPEELESKIYLVRCSDEAGSWKCVFGNRTSEPFSFRGYMATGYDSYNVKIASDSISDTIDPKGMSKISFSIAGYSSNVSKIVISPRY